ncbi:MAG: glycine cleavage system protein H [Candidatus Marinimicrobia bacterium]|jgi:glycine cleavage system H protein|nr:glycine cleavage system protein H [Candidatus Neomarinimicrobiota bacterium]MBT4359550.1 glycine cleavage system protein H [Candidatus Neomarinimicrobiota bacterium]MBT4714192.1 glycine cleavage system protein H [Candidatus Neomarinimicrobiota bacterium]MBT4945552.1 glycine cleavage system protein H [Candidatus Neomarinimicrobiota bacterium]MBT5314164.1 glycine cleavage system protein H [Candidatus Neomarinimicrobiota bacterium]
MKQQFKFKPGFYYNSNHLWIKEDDSGQLLVGMDELGLDSMGELAYLMLPTVGSPVELGKAMGSIEAAKMTSELIAPLSGIVMERNEAALRNPLLVNEKPYDEGWLVRIEPTQWAVEANTMISGDQVTAWWNEEIERFETQGMLD